MKIVFFWLLSFAAMFGWNELENTNGDYVRNFLRGAWVGILIGTIVGMLVALVLRLLGVI